MTLKKYIKKRKFNKTPEPAGKKRMKKGKGALSFVIHEHFASHLHYDFRLELDGVLKSWAVPKGPSNDPEEKRLAVHVEDHPFEYGKFHGTIPKGNYGAGKVNIWDKGTYSSFKSPSDSREDNEKTLRQELKKGHLHLLMKGKKLKGGFTLVRTGIPGAKENWLLIKKPDIHAGKKLRISHQAHHSEEPDHSAHLAHRYSHATPDKNTSTQIKPMLSTRVNEAFDRKGWIFEVKWDGYRTIARVENKKVKLTSRHNLSYNELFAPIAESLQKIKFDAIFDGEVVVVDKKGRSDFQLLQDYKKTNEGNLVYYVFDLLFYKGKDLRALPLLERKKMLKKILPKLPNVKYSDHILKKGKKFFKIAVKNGLEGIVAKDSASAYHEGLRTNDWLKIKTYNRQEAVIAGITAPRKSRTAFGALVLGVYEKGELTYIGHTGGGFDEKTLTSVYKLLQKYKASKSPFKKIPKTNEAVQWVRPKIVCEVRFSNWTQDGIMRQPIFMGLRDDKKAEELKREKPISTKKVVEKSSPSSSKVTKKSAGSIKHSSKSSSTPEQPLTHLSKIFWPKEKYTKGDVIEYYREIAPFLLPYLKNRPENLNRFPNGINGESFFQKNMADVPPGIKTHKIFSPTEKKYINYLVCNDKETLLYMANLGCIEINPWNAQIGSLDNPDYLVLDLDPLDVSFSKVTEVALGIRKILDKAHMESFCKTSGATGLHIYVPLGAKYTTDQTLDFAKIFMSVAQRQMPDITSIERSPSKRKRRVYLDFLQNRRGQTMACAYSLRPKSKAPVATPLRWSEVESLKDPTVFNITNTFKRLDKIGDIWKGVLGKGIDMKKALDKLERI